MAEAGLAHLASLNATSLTTAEQADCLRALEQMESRHTAARASVLSAFAGTGGHEDDGHGSAKAWLKWQTRVTGGAAAGAMGWARRLAVHPAVAEALAAGEMSESWARLVCAWTDLLPDEYRADADAILLGAATGGADLRDLAGLAEEIRNRCAGPDADEDDGFTDRGLRLGTTFRGAGRLDGDLTPGCAAALGAVLRVAGQEGRPGGHAHQAAALSRCAGGGLPPADRRRGPAGSGRAADADHAAHEPGPVARVARRGREGGGLARPRDWSRRRL